MAETIDSPGEQLFKTIGPIALVLALSWVALCNYKQNNVIAHAPRVPNAASGNVYAFRNHSETIYVGKSDLIYVQWFSFPLGAVPILLAVGVARLLDRKT